MRFDQHFFCKEKSQIISSLCLQCTNYPPGHDKAGIDGCDVCVCVCVTEQDHEVQEDKIMLVSLLMAELGVHSVAYAFPKVKIITTAVDKSLDDNLHVIPGIGKQINTHTHCFYNCAAKSDTFCIKQNVLACFQSLNL